MDSSFLDRLAEEDQFRKDVDDHGMVFYRCYLCNKIINKWDIEKHRSCPKCGHSKISPTNLSLWEKTVQICKHPAIWKWSND